jgi:hypothetical protein
MVDTDSSDLHWQCQSARLIRALRAPSLLAVENILKATTSEREDAERMRIRMRWSVPDEIDLSS